MDVPAQLSPIRAGAIAPLRAVRRHPVATTVLIGSVVTALLILLTTTVGGPERAQWMYAQRTAAGAAAVLTCLVGAIVSGGFERRVRLGLAGVLGLWLAGQLIVDVLATAGPVPVPSFGDPFFLATILPILGSIVAATRRYNRGARAAAVYLDGAAVFLAIMAAVVVVHSLGDRAGLDDIGDALALAYPVCFVGAAGAALVGAVANRAEVAFRGVYLMAIGMVALGIAHGLTPAFDQAAGIGQLRAHLLSPGLILIGIGGATWRLAREERSTMLRAARAAQDLLPVVAGGIAALTLLAPGVLGSPHGSEEVLLDVAVAATMILLVLRQTILLRERSAVVGALRAAHEEAQAALADNRQLAGALQERIDEMRQVEAQLIVVSKQTAVGELAAAVAHEVNNPLTGVLGYADLLLSDLPPDGAGRQELETIRDEALRARNIIRALLEFARRRTPEHVETQLNELVATTLGLLRYHVERGEVRIEESYADLPPVQCDPGDVGQVLVNLVNNAVQAMPNGGTLRIETRVEGDLVALAVIDDGVGMDETTAVRAFEPFFTTHALDAGRGLGLAVCLSIVQSHGGSIAIDSSPGQGTTVEVRLPIVAVTPARLPGGSPGASAPKPVGRPA